MMQCDNFFRITITYAIVTVITVFILLFMDFIIARYFVNVVVIIATHIPPNKSSPSLSWSYLKFTPDHLVFLLLLVLCVRMRALQIPFLASERYGSFVNPKLLLFVCI